MIPMVDLRKQYKNLKSDIDAAIQGVLESTQFILGPNVAELEKEISIYHHVDHAIGVASGTDALLLALRACGVKAGDEVLTTPFTFIATADVISLLQATPVFVDIEPDTYNIDPARLEEKITKKTKAIIPVHLFGHAADMTPIIELARKNNLRVIEDCAQAFGATYNGKKVGTLGDCGCFSFFPSKNLAGYGDGGMIITGNNDLAEKLKLFRNHGSETRYHHRILGYNSRLDEIQAAVLRIKLKYIDQYNDLRIARAAEYTQQLQGTSLRLPVSVAGYRHIYHLYVIETPKRDDLQAFLKSKGVIALTNYPIAIHQQEGYPWGTDCDPKPCAANCEQNAAECLSLPINPEITSEEVKYVCDCIKEWEAKQ